MLLPVLSGAKLNHRQAVIGDDDLSFVYSAVEKIVHDLGEHGPDGYQAGRGTAELSRADVPSPITIFGCPGHGEADRIALEMLGQLIEPEKWALELIDPKTLAAELIARIAAGRPALVCIATVPPGGLARTRYLCKRIRANFPALRLIVCWWGSKAGAQLDPGGLKKAGADSVTATLAEARQRISSLLPVLAATHQDAELVRSSHD